MKQRTSKLTEPRDPIGLLRIQVPRLNQLAAEHDAGRAEGVGSEEVDDVSGYEAAGAAHFGVMTLVPATKRKSAVISEQRQNVVIEARSNVRTGRIVKPPQKGVIQSRSNDWTTRIVKLRKR